MNIYVLHLLFTQKQENREFINDVTRVLTGLNLIQSTIVLTVLSYWFGKGEWTMGSTACKLHSSGRLWQAEHGRVRVRAAMVWSVSPY